MQENTNNMETVQIPKSKLPRVVIIGGGFAGLSIAKSLKNKPVQVVLLDKNNFHQFQPLLYQVATSGLMPDSIIFPLRKQLEKYNNIIFRMANVLNVQADKKIIKTAAGTINYDYLVIASGSDTNFFGLKDVQANSLGMKSIQEALNIRSMILQRFEQAALTKDKEERDALTNFAVIGGGPAGVETVGAIAEFKKYILPKDYPDLNVSSMKIYLIEAADKLLGSMSKKASAKALLYLEKMGVTVCLNTVVQSFDGMTIRTNTDTAFNVRGVIWTAGVKGNPIGGLDQENIARGNRIIVDAHSEVIGQEDIFAIGDVAAMLSDNNPKGHPMLAQVAMQQGKLLGKNILNKINKQALKDFHYHDKGSMATIGKRKAVADLKHFHFGGRLAWFLWSFVHLYSIIGFRNKIIVGISWLWSYLNYDKSNRLIVRKYKCSQGDCWGEELDKYPTAEKSNVS